MLNIRVREIFPRGCLRQDALDWRWQPPRHRVAEANRQSTQLNKCLKPAVTPYLRNYLAGGPWHRPSGGRFPCVIGRLCVGLSRLFAELHSSECFVVLCVRLFLRKVEMGRGQDLAPHMDDEFFLGRETGSRPHILGDFFGGREIALQAARLTFSRASSESRGQAPALAKTGSTSEEGCSQPHNEMEFWPFPRRDVKLSQSVFSVSVVRTSMEWQVHASRLHRDSSETFPLSAHPKVCSRLRWSPCCHLSGTIFRCSER